MQTSYIIEDEVEWSKEARVEDAQHQTGRLLYDSTK